MTCDCDCDSQLAAPGGHPHTKTWGPVAGPAPACIKKMITIKIVPTQQTPRIALLTCGLRLNPSAREKQSTKRSCPCHHYLTCSQSAGGGGKDKVVTSLERGRPAPYTSRQPAPAASTGEPSNYSTFATIYLFTCS